MQFQLDLTAEQGIRILSITIDGAQANITILKELGAQIPDKSYFGNLMMDHQVFHTLDPVHIFNLVRNALRTLRRFKFKDGELDYTYIENLQQLYKVFGLRLANKLTHCHMNWKNYANECKTRCKNTFSLSSRCYRVAFYYRGSA